MLHFVRVIFSNFLLLLMSNGFYVDFIFFIIFFFNDLLNLKSISYIFHFVRFIFSNFLLLLTSIEVNDDCIISSILAFQKSLKSTEIMLSYSPKTQYSIIPKLPLIIISTTPVLAVISI